MYHVPDTITRNSSSTNFLHQAIPCLIGPTRPSSVELLFRTWVTFSFLQNIKVAAGKSRTDKSKADAREWARARIREDLVIARGMLVQAGQLGILLSRLYELCRRTQLARLIKLHFADRNDVVI